MIGHGHKARRGAERFSNRRRDTSEKPGDEGGPQFSAKRRDGTESPSVVLCLTHSSAWSRSQLATACGRGCSRSQGHRERQWIGCREPSRVDGRGVSRGAEVMTTAIAPMYQWHIMSWTKIER